MDLTAVQYRGVYNSALMRVSEALCYQLALSKKQLQTLVRCKAQRETLSAAFRFYELAYVDIGL